MDLHLFEAFGIELEYMIVGESNLNVMPVTDELLKSIAGSYEDEVERADVSWSNELALHVVEMKTTNPVHDIERAADSFQKNVQEMNGILKDFKARLMPSAMHPWMDPIGEMKLWPHGYNEVYEAFNKIFNTQGHGWANLQSVHINFPFSGDAEFAKLHAAIRLVLPILPALAASSPVMDGKLTGLMDNRLEVYRNNANVIPSVAGKVIPEPVFTKKDYDEVIFKRMFEEIAPYDPDKVLQHEWLNSRGATARFDRSAIEIRVLDVQECPLVDASIAALVIGTVEALTQEFSATLARQKEWEVNTLHGMLLHSIKDADEAIITDQKYLDMFGFKSGNKCRASELWQHLSEEVLPKSSMKSDKWTAPLKTLTHEGTLARRITKALNGDDSRENLHRVYEQLCDCLEEGKMFR
jgi:gamma-glutamyl:cysteine ligase YbdK (ATP-grasp superfamily)